MQNGKQQRTSVTKHPRNAYDDRPGVFVAMKKNGRGRRKKRKIRAFFIAVCVLVIAVCIFIFAENTMKTTLSSAAEIKSKEIIEQIINSAVYDQTHQEDGTELEIIHTAEDSEGNLQLVTLNTSLLNKIGTEIAKRVNNDIYYEKADKIRLSLGSLLGSRLLSQTGPYFTFDIVPVAVINVGYKTEFESTGINQSKYKVYLDVKTETRLMVPFMSEKFETVNTVLIAEAVIVGEVPGTYTNIPEEDVSELVPG